MKIYKTNSISLQRSKKYKFDPALIKIESVKRSTDTVEIFVTCKNKYLELYNNSSYDVNGDSCSVIKFIDVEKNTQCDLCFADIFKVGEIFRQDALITPLKYEYRIVFINDETEFFETEYEYFSVKHTQYVDGKDRITKLKS